MYSPIVDASEYDGLNESKNDMITERLSLFDPKNRRRGTLTTMVYHLAADAILILHVLFVAFVIGGLLLVFLGKYRGWSWVRNPWFRSAHVAAIVVVILQSWAGRICPLTTLENALRVRAGDTVYSGTFISHLLEYIIYYRLPLWVFAMCYTAFGALVIASWIWVRPRPFNV